VGRQITAGTGVRRVLTRETHKDGSRGRHGIATCAPQVDAGSAQATVRILPIDKTTSFLKYFHEHLTGQLACVRVLV
jgi:hypothetical protein